MKLIMAMRLMEAGYPMAADDLEIEEWLDISRVKQVFKQPLNSPAHGTTQS